MTNETMIAHCRDGVMPVLTNEHREESIACAKNVLSASWANDAMKRNAAIALAALTAEPVVWIKPDALGVPRWANIEAVTIPYVVEFPVELYTAPPVPMAKPIELPSIDDITIPVELALAANETELFLQQYRYYTIQAIRAAGYEVTS